MNIERGHLWNVWLKFEDIQNENEYRTARSHAISALSGQTHGIALFLGIVAFLANLHHDYHPVTRLCTFHDCIVMPTIVVYLSLRHNRFFTAWYDWIVVFSEVTITISATYARSFLGPLDSTTFVGVINHFCTVSPLAGMVLMAVAYRTSIQAQFLGQLATVFLSKSWVSWCCRGGDRLVDVDSVVDMMGWSIESFFGGLGTMFTTSARLSRGTTALFPCWMVAGYFHFAVGFVLPCTVKYILECYGRAKFLVCKFHPSSHHIVWRHFWDAFWFSFFVALTVLVSSWMLFRSIAL